MPRRSRSNTSPEQHFTGSVAIVTGGASGIGRAIAQALVRRGAHVVVADIDEAAAKETAHALGSAARAEVVGVGLDVRDADAVRALVERTAADNGRLDLMFNNAGIGIFGPVHEMQVEHFDRLIDVNVRGVVHGVLAAYPLMVRQGHGHIVNTASSAGLLPAPMLAAYGMTKHAVVGLSVALRLEGAATGVKVSVVCPGVIDTPLLDRPNPEDLAAIPTVPDGRALLTKIMGHAYPPESLAEDILAAVARNQVFIVSPRHARIPWYLYRISPRLILDGGRRFMRRAVRLTQRRAD
jgi:NAD(P)-dependent dehydrogenase (short-subunit alcohol dehydrogenase family)